MQESYYRILVKLDGPLLERREELLSKIERFKDDLKGRGHSGRYGLQNLICYSPFVTHATCLASTNHPEGASWLDYELTRLRENEINRRATLEKNIDEQIKSFNRHKDKEKFMTDLKSGDYTRFGLSYIKDQEPMEPDEYIGHLEQLKRQPLNYAGFNISPVFIEPVKPSKKEIENERLFLKHLNEVPTEKKRYEDTLMRKIKGTSETEEQKK